MDVKMLTGDSLNTARAIANECGILEGAKEEEEVVMLGSELDERIHFVDDKAPMVERRQFRMGKESFGLAPPFKLDGEGRKLVNVKAFVDIAPKLKVSCLPSLRVWFRINPVPSRCSLDVDPWTS